MITATEARAAANRLLWDKRPDLVLLGEPSETEEYLIFPYGDPQEPNLLDSLVPDAPILVVSQTTGTARFVRVAPGETFPGSPGKP